MQAWLNSNLLWTQFLVCGALIVLSGMKLSRLGDIIGEKLKIGSTWIGLVLLAAVTSMPELITSCTAGAIGAPDMAVGNLFGSNLFNLAILGILGVAMPRLARWNDENKGHILSCGLNQLIMSVAIVAIVLYRVARDKMSLQEFSLANIPIGLCSITLVAVYLLSMYLLFVYERKSNSSAQAAEESYKDEKLLNASVKFALFSAVIVGAGWRMVILGDILAEKPINLFGTQLILGQSVIGTFFLAVATSLPEFTVCFAAIRMGSMDMAIGNVFGSNIFNLATIFLADVFYTGGPILANIGAIHLATGTIVILISVIFILSSKFRPLFVGFGHLPISITIVLLWLYGWALVFFFGGGPSGP
ncbi:MAG: hypothetical protein JW941_05910 [Candidatus Coatesbacteria bacterium]|nr:hypothetical protein [Candidatus Coatesbacteria bacterium]